MEVTVIGAGLAGSEAAYQLSKRGIKVRLYEMRPHKLTPAHKSADFAELVCSNSLRADRLENAAGLLKEEMRRLDSVIMRCADANKVPAGGALAVDREGFPAAVTEALQAMPNIRIIREECAEITPPCIIAAGPLCSDKLAQEVSRLTGEESLSFYDAAAPIVLGESLDMSRIFRAGRYGRGEDYLNCPMSREEYDIFVNELINAETAHIHGFEGKVFEGCMPVEVMAARGHMSLAFGPLKPKGLIDPFTGRMPYAAVQLRQDDAAASLYNLVGFQTHLKFGEQKRVFSMIPGLENAEFVRYGVMHRNTYICSPRLLDRFYQLKSKPGVFFAGQITGVEGYIESAASGLLAALSMYALLNGGQPYDFTSATAIGALGAYISSGSGKNFQPMNITFGIMEPLEAARLSKAEKNQKISARALKIIDSYING